MGNSVVVDTKSIDRLTIELKNFPKLVPAAQAAALNRTLDHVATKIGRIVPQEYAIKVTEVKKSLNKKKATKNDLSANIVSRGHTLSIAHFPHTPNSPIIARSLGASHKKAQIKVKVKKGKMAYIKSNPKPFLASTGATSSDKVQFNVFRRKSDKRFPIVVLRTLSIPQMIGSEKNEAEIQKVAADKLSERTEHEINWRLNQIQKKLAKKG